MFKRSSLIILGLVLLVTTLGLAQQLSIGVHPQAEPGIVCYTLGQAQLQCPFNPALASQQAGGITQTPAATLGPGATATRTPPTNTATLPPVTSTSTVTPAPPLSLVNGDFESSWSAGWTRFDRWSERPVFNDERGDPRSRHGGAQSLRIWNEHRCFLAGVYQKVSVPKFSTIRASVWGRTWAANGFNFDLPSDTSVKDGIAIGIDPAGGTDPRSSGIIWVENESTEVWRHISVQAVALSSNVTVFIQARLGVIGPDLPDCQWPKAVMMAFIDDATIEIVP